MIWCVEDDASIRDIEVYTLSSTGFDARGFEDGVSFWSALQTEKPDLVVLDVMLPGVDGIELLQRMKDQAEIIICIYSGDIINSKTRQDFGITYDLEVLRLIDIFRKYNLKINSVVVTRYEDAPAVNRFINKLERRDIKTYKHCFTKG